jgi:hypothetical protein
MKLSTTKIYRQNRARIPIEELSKHSGRWVAFSADGQRIVASGDNLRTLADETRAAGEDMQDVVVEHIEMESGDLFLGGAGLS